VTSATARNVLIILNLAKPELNPIIDAHNMNSVKALDRIVGSVLEVQLADSRLRVENITQNGVQKELSKLAPLAILVSLVDGLRSISHCLRSRVGIDLLKLRIAGSETDQVAVEHISHERILTPLVQLEARAHTR
jgi:hypothetical protein